MSKAFVMEGTKPQVIAFEGLDGSGKSTVIGLVAQRLRDRGMRVFLPRAGKEHTSRPTRMIRRLTRDPRNLALCPRAEMALYCAREAQVLDEQVRPALARGETVILDRSLLTPVVLGAWGRGIAREDCEVMARASAGGLEPERTIILDVHPRTSRIRKRLAEVRAPSAPDPGRKGLSGSGLKERVHAGYLKVARDRGFPVFHTERVSPEVVAERVCAFLEHGTPPSRLEDRLDSVPFWQLEDEMSFAAALEGLPSDLALYMTRNLIFGRRLRQSMVEREPALVTWGLDADDSLLRTMASLEPAHALGSLTGRPLSSDDLRVELADAYPDWVARALRRVNGSDADGLRERLADRAPGSVVESLVGREDPWGWALRRRLWDEAEPHERATSLSYCRGGEAWRLREKLLDREPLMGLRSLRGVADPRAYTVLGKHADIAPKAILSAITGDGSPEAHALRLDLATTGREVIDSLGNLSDEPSWRLREQSIDLWPSSVLGSLLDVAVSPRWRTVRDACATAGARDVHALRWLEALQERTKVDTGADIRASAGRQ